MIRREASALNLHWSREPRQSVEVQADGLEESGRSVDDVARSALKQLARTNPQISATVYLYGSMSVNFHVQAWSEFLIPVGKSRDVDLVLKSLERAFHSSGAPCRPSDHVRPSESRELFHIEDGRLWQIEDAVTWFSDGDTANPPEAEAAGTTQDATGPKADEVCTGYTEDEDWDWGDEPRGKDGVRGSRRVRSDASIGTVRTRIERTLGLPAGSVHLCGPDGRPLRADALIRTLRARWE